ncbi:MAG TPA: AsmA-like C-terminal region-containing protein, partial [Microvirga sp.]|nr:AsmA-like C-terminal region-containing protein [Microvirga sp.]
IAGFEAEPDTLKGRADFRIALPLNLDHVPKFADLPISLTGTISDLAVEGLIGKEKLEGAALAVAYDKGALAIKGEGRIGGSPATIEVRQAKDAGEASLAFTFDDAARARKGLTFGSQLTGPLLMRVNLPLGRNAKPGTRVEADLSRAAVDGLIPGWQKPAGRPGKLTLTLLDGGDKGSDIRDLQLDAGTVQVRGTAHLAADGGLDRADLATFKLSPGDDMRAQLERTGSVYKVTIRGNTGDARPFTRSFNASPAPAGRGPAAPKDRDQKDVDLDLALNILTGHNDEAITNASVKASLRRDALRQLDVKGRIGSSNIMAQTVVRGGNPLIVMQAEDAGATLRFLDIYRRMVGGDLVLQLNSGDGPQTGFVTLSAFSLRNEPALRRIIPTQSQVISGRDKAGNQQNVRIDVNEVAFTRARVDFTRLAGRLDFKDAAIYGQAIGFTLGGFIDYARDRVDIEGTFVPAFGLNNAFAQVPLFGPLLGGGRNEGLFAVNFRIAGQATQPTLSVNPLSAVAPGFLRKLFGAGGGEAPAGSVYIPPENGSN